MLHRSRSIWMQYGAATAAIALSIVVRLVLGHFTTHTYPFATIFLAIVFSAWYGGFGPSLLAATLGFASMLIWPDSRPTPGSYLLGVLFYVAISLVVAALGGLMARARERIENQIAELTRQQNELHVAAQRKDEFLAVLAHELRNPLAPIASALDILKQPRLDPAIASLARDTADRQLQHLTRLVDDLLDVSRIMRGKIELRKERVDVRTIVERAIETVQPLIDQDHHQLTVSLPDLPIWVDADLVRLSQVLSNLLSNAVKYTEPGGQIRLLAAIQDRELVVSVQDSGIGIASETLPKLFDMFMQALPGAGRSRGGLGIGLTLVKNLVEMHGGTVTAHSEGLRQGSEFVIRLPYQEVPAAPSPEPQPLPLPPPPRAENRPRRILVVDDNVDAAQSLALLLRLRGHVTRTVFGGREALDAVAQEEPDTVLLDIGMPGMDGYEVARRLRAEYSSALTLVAITGWGAEQDRQRSKAAGFDHHLTKPVDLTSLERVLQMGTSTAELQAASP